MTEPVVAARMPARMTLGTGKDYWRGARPWGKEPICDDGRESIVERTPFTLMKHTGKTPVGGSTHKTLA